MGSIQVFLPFFKFNWREDFHLLLGQLLNKFIDKLIPHPSF